MKISIIIPTKNEHGNVDRLIKKINEITEKYNLDNELLVIDDNSTDGTIEDVEKICRSQKNLHLYQRSQYSHLFPKYPKKWKYLGIGSAHKVGYNLAKGDFIITIDADLSQPPEKIMDLINLLKNGYDIGIGSRYIKGAKSEQRILNHIISRVGNIYLSIMFRLRITDFSNGYRIIKKEIWEKIKRYEYTNANNFLIELLYYGHVNGAKIGETPIYFKKREIGNSKTPFKEEVLKALYLPIKLKRLNQKSRR